jgi:hypothetical protein
MTKDEALKLALEAGFRVGPSREGPDDVWGVGANLERFAKLVAAKEREACAKLAQETICDTHIPTGVNIYGTRAAKAIRARGEA